MWYKSKRFSSSGVSKLINEFSTKKQRTLISHLRGKHVFIQLKLIRRNICDEVHILLTSKRLLLSRLFPISYLIIKSSIVSHFSLLIFTPLLLLLATTGTIHGHNLPDARLDRWEPSVYIRLVTEQVLSWETRTKQKIYLNFQATLLISVS